MLGFIVRADVYVLGLKLSDEATLTARLRYYRTRLGLLQDADELLL